MAHYADVPVVNPPEAVIRCERVENSRRFESESNFIFPKTRHIDLDALTFDQVLSMVETGVCLASSAATSLYGRRHRDEPDWRCGRVARDDRGDAP